MAVSKDTSNKKTSSYPTEMDDFSPITSSDKVTADWLSKLYSGASEVCRHAGVDPLTGIAPNTSWSPSSIAEAIYSIGGMIYTFKVAHNDHAYVSQSSVGLMYFQSKGNWWLGTNSQSAMALPSDAPDFTLTNRSGSNGSESLFTFITTVDENEYSTDGGSPLMRGSYTRQQFAYDFSGSGGKLSGVYIPSLTAHCYLAEDTDWSTADEFVPLDESLGDKIFTYITIMELPF
ncbi:MAG: hypothetical protein Unbinned4098contig1000_26 [Prokaryotic dsDNA virus sp.]|mgnify:FL=1|nr:MAG: hypothetical protein Unbinned4098contig1000_26 [Prokaryotic dsDNA virus sp.]|tara:strand:- start:5353 stop:6048 length:696 start_codon:yes stop_codon:yes gene_type:complete